MPTPHPCSATESTSRRRPCSLGLGLALALVALVLFLALVGAGLWGDLWDERNSLPAATSVEAAILPVLGGLPLVETVIGNEGLVQVNRLHGKDVKLVRGYIAWYVGDRSRATMWVGWTESEAGAQALADRMTAKIGPDHSVFQGLEALVVDGRTVYSATGQGQQHYYFCSGAAVVWVAVDGTAAREVMHDALRLFP